MNININTIMITLNVFCNSEDKDTANTILTSLNDGDVFVCPLCDNENNVITHYAGSTTVPDEWITTVLPSLLPSLPASATYHIGDFDDAMTQEGLVFYESETI